MELQDSNCHLDFIYYSKFQLSHSLDDIKLEKGRLQAYYYNLHMYWQEKACNLQSYALLCRK